METAIILLAIVYFAMFYFMKMRPEKQRKKEKEDMRKSLAVGDEVTMIGGVIGTVCAVKENTVVIETGADRVRLEFAHWGIMERGVIAKDDK
ncbi:MAG: preprotein translocase subunit YajC [Evtepia sp.]